MKLFYCLNCFAVYLFNVFDIEKHDLEKVSDKPCLTCGTVGPVFAEFEVESWPETVKVTNRIKL